MAKAGAVRAGRAYVELFADSSKLVRGLKLAQRRLRNFGRSLRSIGTKMTGLGMAGMLPAGLGAKWFMDFEDSMLQVQAVTSASGREFDLLSDKARALGRSTSFTASQVANAMLELGRAGFAPTEIDAAITSMLQLARATGTELPEAAQIAAATLRGFGMEATEMTRVADVMVATANTSAQTLIDLGESMKYVAPIASEAGMSLEDTAKALGTMANMGIKGSMAGTSLRMALLRLSNVKVQKMLRAVGVEALNASGDLRNVGDIFLDIGKAMSKMSSAQRLAWMQRLFNARAVTGAVKLATSQFERLNMAIEHSSGTAQRTSAQMESGMGGSFRRLKSAVQDVAITIGEALAPTLQKLAAWITEAANRVSAFIVENQGLILAIGGISAGLVTLGPLIISTGMAFQALAALTGAAAISIGALATPIGLAIVKVGALGAAFLAFTPAGREFAREAKGLATDTLRMLSQTFSETFRGISAAIAGADIATGMEILRAGFRVQLLQLKDVILSGAEAIRNSLEQIMRDIAWRMQPPHWQEDFRQMGKAVGMTGQQVFEQQMFGGPAGQKSQEAMLKRAAELADARAKLLDLQRTAEANAARVANMPVRRAMEDAMRQHAMASKAQAASEEAVPTPAATRGALGAAGRALWTTGQSLFGAAKAGANDLVKAAGAIEVALPGDETFQPALAAVGAARAMAGEVRGTFSGAAAARMGGVLGVSPMERAARGIDGIAQKTEHTNKRLDQLVDAAKKAKLVFTGQLPG